MGYRIGVGGVGVALVFFAIAAAVILATGHDPTQAFWTIASGLAGALVGIVAPSPSEAKAGPAGREAVQAHVAAAAAASAGAAARQAEAEQALANHQPARAAAAASDADTLAQAASTRANAAAAVGRGVSPAMILLLVVFVGCELVVLLDHSKHFTPDISKQLQAFATAAAGAAIGLLAPSPTKG
jgi:hypothetical protein